MGQGTKTIFPQLVAEALGVAVDDVEIAPQDTALVPDSGPTVASRTAMVVGGLLIKAAPAAAGRGRGARPAAPFADDLPRLRAASTARSGSTSSFEPYPGVGFDDETYRGDAYPAFGWAACVATVEVDLDTGEVHGPRRGRRRRRRPGHPPGPRRGPGRGRHAPGVGYATIEEIKLRDGRYLNDRLATYIIPTALDAPRITTILVEAPFSGAPHGAKGVGELPMDVGAPAVVAAIHDATGVWIARPAGQPGADPRGAGGRARRRAAAARRVRAGARRPADDRVPLHGQRRRRSRSTCPGCAACSTSCARTSA